MVIQIDFENKIIRIENSINLGELYEKLNELFKDNQWKEFLLSAVAKIEVVNPITYPLQPFTPYPTYPWDQPYYQQPIIYCEGTQVSGYDGMDYIYSTSKVENIVTLTFNK